MHACQMMMDGYRRRHSLRRSNRAIRRTVAVGNYGTRIYRIPNGLPGPSPALALNGPALCGPMDFSCRAVSGVVPTLRPRHGPKVVFSCRTGTTARLDHRAGVGPSGSAGPSTWHWAAAGARVAAAGRRRPAQITTSAPGARRGPLGRRPNRKLRGEETGRRWPPDRETRGEEWGAAARSGDDGRRKGVGDGETSAPCAYSRCSSPSRVRRRLEEEQEGVGGGMGRR
jgi:hypothetical protein